MATVGIDLGTTNTVIAQDMRVLRFDDSGETSPILASVVAYPPTGIKVVGQAARRRRAINPKNTIFSAKRLMASRWYSHRTNEFRTQYPFHLVQMEDGRTAFATRAGLLTPQNIATTIAADIFRRVGLSPSEISVMVTVPAEFDDLQREETVSAIEAADVHRVEILDEPTATAWAYMYRTQADHRRVAVYDLGGGTFDLAVIECTGETFRVLGHGGDAYLGGDDLDRRIARWAAEETLRTTGWDLQSDLEVFDRLVIQCERAKIRLSENRHTEIPLAQIDPAAPQAALPLPLDENHFAELATDLVRRTFSICDEVLRDVGIRAQDLDAVFLAGGTTQLPIIRKGIAQYFNTPPRCDYDPMEVVSIGASLAANQHFGSKQDHIG